MNSEKIMSFLDSHELISVHALEIKIGMAQSTIGQTKHGRKIPKKFITPICEVLKDYGMNYKPKLAKDETI